MARLPSFNLAEIFRRRERLRTRVLDQYVGTTVDGDALDRLTAALRTALPSGATGDAVFESVRYLAGKELTANEALRLAWRLAGNMPRLREGQAVGPWSAQPVNEWVPLQVLRAVPGRNSRDHRGTELSLRVLAGSPCPMRINAFWKRKAIRFVAYRVGFSRWRDGTYPFQKAQQLVGLRFMGLIEAERSRTRPEFHELECPQSYVNWNRNEVLRLRLRVDQNCPNGWVHACHNCVVGYDECVAGTHKENYEVGTCNQCGHVGVFFDPEDHSLHCINCTTRIRLRRTTS